MATARNDEDTLEPTDVSQTGDEETVVTVGDGELPQAAPAETDLTGHLRT